MLKVVLQALCLLASSLSLSRAAGDFYSLSAVDITGNDVQMERYRGKVSSRSTHSGYWSMEIAKEIAPSEEKNRF